MRVSFAKVVDLLYILHWCTLVPGPPETLELQSKGAYWIVINWKEPKIYVGKILGYKV